MYIYKESESTSMPKNLRCGNCGFPVISACNNNGFSTGCKDKNGKDAVVYDYWIYCSNKGCENHNGSNDDMGDDNDWIITINEDYTICQKSINDVDRFL